jgi:kumamolisin
VNVFVSSGDAGSNPDITGHNSTGPTQAEYGASDPSVISVGGTTLTLKSNGSVNAESGWASGGGGVSVFFDRPSWQVASGVPAGTKRLVPDVAAAADPDTGAFLVFHGSVTQYGGTSWSAPVWAGICALINEARLKARKPALPFLNPLLYPLRGTPAFRDITTGSNGAFQAGAGYDLVTGLGVPNVRELITRLP